MKLSKFQKNILRKSLVILVCFVVLVLCIIGITENVMAISDLRKVNAEMDTPKAKVETVIVESPVVVEPETVYFDVPLSHEVQDTIFAECEKYGISPAVIVAMIEQESKCTVDAIGDDGRSVGLMQIQIKWHKQRMVDLGCENLLDPVQNVKVGVDYLAELKEQNNDIFWMLHGYNGGVSYANGQAQKGAVSNYAKTVVARAYELGGDC